MASGSIDSESSSSSSSAQTTAARKDLYGPEVIPSPVL